MRKLQTQSTRSTQRAAAILRIVVPHAVVACCAGAIIAGAQTPNRPLPASLQPYARCKPSGGPDLVDITPLLAANSVRTVQTSSGDRQVQLVDGARLMFAYPSTDFFANMKVEELPAASYAQGKEDLVRNFDYLLSTSVVNSRNSALRPTLQGFEIYGQDRSDFNGGVMGMYLLFENATHVATTIYFLNQEPAQRKFATMQEYAALRDQFLAGYAACVRAKLTSVPPRVRKPQ